MSESYKVYASQEYVDNKFNDVSGLPSDSKSNQYLVTDSEGNAKWEDKLAYESVEEIVLCEAPFSEWESYPSDQVVVCKKSGMKPTPGETYTVWLKPNNSEDTEEIWESVCTDDLTLVNPNGTYEVYYVENEDRWWVVRMNTDSSRKADFKITVMMDSVKTIDNRYIKDMYGEYSYDTNYPSKTIPFGGPWHGGVSIGVDICEALLDKRASKIVVHVDKDSSGNTVDWTSEFVILTADSSCYLFKSVEEPFESGMRFLRVNFKYYGGVLTDGLAFLMANDANGNSIETVIEGVTVTLTVYTKATGIKTIDKKYLPSGSGLPSGSKPNQYIVTDGEGNAKWEDKLCWSEEGKVVMPETFVAEPAQQNEGLNVYFINCALEGGKKYTVIYGGVSYDVTSESVDNFVFAGNFGLAGSGLDTGEPFAISHNTSNGDTIVGTRDSGGITIAIYEGEVETVHKLSGKYVEGMGYVEDSLTEILPEQKIVFSLSNNGGYSAMISDSSYWAIGDNEDLKVVFDGVEYYCTSATYQVNDNITMYLFGNLGRMGIGDDNGMPFVGAATLQDGTPSSGSVTAFTSEESHTFGVYRVSETVHPIDKKYLMGSNLRVFITVDENDEYVASNTYEEIKNHILSGGTCDCVYGASILRLNTVTFMSDVSTFASLPILIAFVGFDDVTMLTVTITVDDVVAFSSRNLSFEDT